MKKQVLIFGILLTIFSCSTNELIENELIEEVIDQPKELLSKSEINKIIQESLEEKGDFKWSEQDVHTIYSALKHSNNILTIGYGSSKSNFKKSSTSLSIKDQVLTLIRNSEKIYSKTKNQIYVDENINVLDIKVNNKETLIALLNDSRIRYIEPSDYNFFTSNTQQRSDDLSELLLLGCGYRQANINVNDYRIVAPGAKVPWSFDAHKIPQAWNYSTGSGITVAVIDTGLSLEQKWMNQYFNDGYSSGRFVEKYGTYVDSWWYWSNNYDGVNDKCGHGTSMASVAVAPRNNDNLPLGVAYNANLVSYRAVKNVVIDDYHEKRGVSEALIALANKSDVKVISMSLGSPFRIGRVEDAVRYAYSKGKMIIAAGGTSTSLTTWFGVIFPAWMDETVAVTGVKEGTYDNCDICHTGSKIDFTIQMQRRNGTDNKIPVLSYYNGKENYIGGSSIATATTAGIASLIWSRHPNWSREQVLQKMKESADYYPNKHPEVGYGNINALKAVQ
ncbi:MAG: S8 family peptidase [Tenacibaculum sp.]